jgi:LPXTG-motif cell wall-anchored protein
MKNTTFKRVLALVTVFTMVFTAVMVFNTTSVQAAPTGDVLRVTIHNRDAGSEIRNMRLVAGNTYTIHFWMLNESGSPTATVGWAHWPDDTTGIYEAESPLGSWVEHRGTFEAPGGRTNFSVMPAWGERGPDDVYYLSTITITAADGTVQTFNPGDVVGAWSADVITLAVVSAPTAPSVPLPAGGGGGSARVNPLTGDSFNPLWLVASGLGLAISLSALVFVFKKKK